MAEALKILYQDDNLVAVDKPPGLLVHRSNIDKYETRFLLQELRNQLGKHLYPVHRLDKPTSGLILFAFDSQTAAILQEQMEGNTAAKEYLLICRGYTSESGRIEYPLKPLDDFKKRNKKKSVDEKPAQEAVTEYERLQIVEVDKAVDKYPKARYSLVKAKILTGRKHQIRRHFKHISHPIIGCPKYGKSTHNRFFAEQFSESRLLLHSYHMNLIHPLTGEQIDICCQPSGVFSRVIDEYFSGARIS